MENMTGVNETVQIVKVTYNGAERFYRISGNAVVHTTDLVGKLTNLFRFFYEKGKEKVHEPEELRLQEFVKSKDKIGVLQLDNTEMSAFNEYAKENKIDYVYIDTKSNDKMHVLYKQKDARVIDYYVSKNRATSENTTMLEMAKNITLEKKLELTTGENKHVVEISPKQIADIDMKMQTVKIKSIDGRSEMDISLSDIHCITTEKGHKRYCVALNRDKDISLLNSLSKQRLNDKKTIFRYGNEAFICKLPDKNKEQHIMPHSYLHKKMR